jgi:hypothetical protein
VQEGGGSLMF